MLVGIVASIAALGPGCRRPPHRPGPGPTTTVLPTATTGSDGATTTTTTAPAATTSTTAAPGDHHGEHGGGDGPGADDKGWSQLHNGHQDEHGSVPLDEATQREVDRQLDVTRRLAERYPTVAAAEAGGYRRGGPFSPGLGSHYLPSAVLGGGGVSLAPDSPMTDEQLEQPVLIYNGTEPDSPIAGFMYLAYGVSAPPEGFAGPNDHWHNHSNVCVAFVDGVIEVPLGADRDITPEQCTAVGGNLIAITGYMLHVWSVPGWENPDGVFAELTPKITCPDGTYWKVPDDYVGAVTTLCRGGS
jgi:hypothetical protein